jgi:choline dehydrogenase-like flavoprotein
VLAANLGVNPSLTITALAKWAMSFILKAADSDWFDLAHAP